jgi:signal peptidase I
MNDRGWLVRLLPAPEARWIAGAFAPFGAISAVLLFRAMILEPFRIPSGSMVPTVQIGDHVLVPKYMYGLRLPLVGTVLRWGTPQRGEVVVFRYPPDPRLHYLKRVVGVAGDRIAVRDNRLSVNGAPQPWSPEGSYDFVDDTCGHTPTRQAIEDLGGVRHAVLENTGLSGPLADWPRDREEFQVPEGAVFVMGDNRDNAEDSRRWGVVPVDDVLGPAVAVWYSFDPCTGQVRSERFLASLAVEAR